METITQLTGSDVADEIPAAVLDLGGEAQWSEIVDHAIDRAGWSPQARAVPARPSSGTSRPTRPTRLGEVYDQGIYRCRDQGKLVAVGDWRAAPRPTITPRPPGRVFLAGVGVSDAPIDETFRAAHRERVWFAEQPKRLLLDDHVFVIGVGHHGAVVGLYELLGMDVTRKHPHPADPERWSWSVGARPLASVPLGAARRVDGIRAPRALPTQVQDAGTIAALYEAVAEWEVWPRAGESRATGPDRHLAKLRRPTEYVPGRRAPQPQQFVLARLYDAEVQALHEKRRQDHQSTQDRLHSHLARLGWTELQEIHAAIDLWGISPSGQRIIFEIKTLSDENHLSQSRSGLGQLLEYRAQYAEPDVPIVLATDRPLTDQRATPPEHSRRRGHRDHGRRLEPQQRPRSRQRRPAPRECLTRFHANVFGTRRGTQREGEGPDGAFVADPENAETACVQAVSGPRWS